MPYGASGYYHPDAPNEADRDAVNDWIRTPGNFDAVVDFDALMRDPAQPQRLSKAFDSGDGLHPSPEGYRFMGEAVPLSLFADARRKVSAMSAVPTASIATPPGRGARLRWVICGLLFAAVVLSYIDRLVLSVLKPTLQQLYGWSETGYGDVVFWFQAAYGIGFLFFGRLIDRVGAKVGYLLAMGVWTAAHMAHALFTSTRGFALMRVILALGESGTYPAALAAAREWFPRRERALAIGIFNAGANMGAIITPMIVPIIALAMGWRGAFVVTGADQHRLDRSPGSCFTAARASIRG